MRAFLLNFVLILSVYYATTLHVPRNAKPLTPISTKSLKLGTKYLIRSAFGKQDCYITVHEDGVVDSQYLIKGTNGDEDAVSTMQLWSIQPHPYVPGRFELKQDIVPFNELSGLQNTDDDGTGIPIFPRQFTFSQVWDAKYEIQIRIRWCLRFLGRGYKMDIDDCEMEYEPEKLWDFIEVTKE